ncbi:glutamate--cysteine ligase regulatory subunit-like isoform X2 [Acanthaster planci]|nr:glutamate--cysteine ligase regulatory subunit-like isoform X2 [Acanthaster planci]XP_022085300.1 glutamate--cysteine ligase regulatory subunit-like isoform X2 [Acanthaster planci]XP_022085301.1 glutamate--cysteine ligase regulatory subunit-like isoform X2 [Acanthaster planci]
MGTEGPARLPRASLMYISPGNILNYHHLKKTIPKTSTDELKMALNNALKSTMSSSPFQDAITKNDCEEVVFSDPNPKIEYNGCTTPDDIKITVKLMLSNADEGITSQAIAMVLKELSVKKVDGVLLSMPARPFDEELTVEHFKPVWQELEELVRQDHVKTLGVCDMELAMLRELHSWAQVKPTTNQMNQASCCVIPPALKEFANENTIQLVSHSDSDDVLPPEVFQEVLRGHYPEQADWASWHPSWVLRYTALIKNRGIITTKGYIVRAQRVLPL